VAPRFRPQLETPEHRDVPSTLTVTSAADSGPGTLRADIAAAHAGDTIVFAPSLDGKTITLTSGELAINKNLTIQGPGASQLTLSGNRSSRIFEVDGTSSVSLSGLTLYDGYGVVGGRAQPNDGEGGAILNFATLTVKDCTVSNNSAGQYGGGIFNVGTLMVNGCSISNNLVYSFSNTTALAGGAIENTGTATLSNSTLSGNSAGKVLPPVFSYPIVVHGGAIANSGTITISDCTLSGNSAHDMGRGATGGAIYNKSSMTISGSTISGNTVGNPPGYGRPSLISGGGISNDGTLTVTDCTLSANQAVEIFGDGYYTYTGRGGGIYNFGTATLTNCTLSLNSAAQGGGIYVYNNAILNLTNTIVAGNTSPYGNESDIYGPVTTADHNLVGNGYGSSGLLNGVNGNIVGGNGNPVINADLGPLQNNGGPTETMALLAGSPAIGHADNTKAPTTDQRGVTRLDEAGEITDIGAFEL
jgi:predicted outer membrane repeat protein